MTHSTSQDNEARATARGRRRPGPAQFLLAAAGLGMLAGVAIPASATAAECPTDPRLAWYCRGAGTGATPQPMPYWPMPGAGVPGVPAPQATAPVTIPPITVPPVTVPPVMVLSVATAAGPLVPQAVPDSARRLLELANLERQRAGLRALTARDDVTALASAHSTRMALSGDIFHNGIYFSPTTRKRLRSAFRGENVAYNASIDNAHARLMRSPRHRANLLNRRFSVVGFAVVQAPDGRYFITEDFLQPAHPARRR